MPEMPWRLDHWWMIEDKCPSSMPRTETHNALLEPVELYSTLFNSRRQLQKGDAWILDLGMLCRDQVRQVGRNAITFCQTQFIHASLQLSSLIWQAICAQEKAKVSFCYFEILPNLASSILHRDPPFRVCL
jgi:hypothetical protein